MESRRMIWAWHVERIGGEQRYIQGFDGERLRERNHLEDTGIDGRIILRWIFKKWMRDMDWIHLAQDKDR
jgi:hypothetical protein